MFDFNFFKVELQSEEHDECESSEAKCRFDDENSNGSSDKEAINGLVQ